MPILEHELARRESGRLEVRPTPLRVRWALDDLVSADGHRLRGSFSASVRALADKANRQMLEEAFLGRCPVLSTVDVAEHFAPALSAAAAKAAASHPAADLLGAAGGNGAAPAGASASGASAMGGASARVVEALRAAGNRVAFACGLELLPAFQLELESPTFRQQKQEELERALVEQRAAGQVKHFERAAQLLRQFEALRQSAPQLSPSAVLEQISPIDRGTMLQTLLLASARAQRTPFLWLVAGPYLVRVDGHASPPKAQLVPLPPTLGPLRSVQAASRDGKPVLLVGARGGVMIVHADAPASGEGAAERDADLFLDWPTHPSQHGFSRAVLWAGSLWACHGEAGIRRWSLEKEVGSKTGSETAKGTGNETKAAVEAIAAEQPVPPDLVIRPDSLGGPPRHLTVLDESRLLFSVGGRLMTLSPRGPGSEAPSPARSDVVAIVPDERAVYVAHEDGTLVTRDRATLDVLGTESRGTKIVAAGALPWLGSRRLLLAGESGPIQCVGFDDPLVSEYVSPHRAPRMVAGAADLVAAVSADRQRVVLWNSWEGRRPLADLSIAGLARHRVVDLAFA